ncbi:hypothetical protein GUJ93_ZPchr0004g39631 [Zizania palustris]|uniref:Uncharacterized protein n=1 Tax=Zizania palustris TaxID=103762 RepID=A0A8J5VFW9_ZIZPA|nr:hypothetical protein GUJ93_ZPchr0004g39631 [Zizania palustris]
MGSSFPYDRWDTLWKSCYLDDLLGDFFHLPRMDIDEDSPSVSFSGWPIRYRLASASTNLGTDCPTPTAWENGRRS